MTSPSKPRFPSTWQAPLSAPSQFPPAPDLPLPPAPPSPPLPEHRPGEPLKVSVIGDALRIGNVTVTFHRTLRIPDDGGAYPLPPSLGRFPVRRVAAYEQVVPASWREHGGVFLPMFQREAMWLSFSGAHWRPNAVKVAVGKVNALSGKPWTETLQRGGRGDDTQDYMVVPDQPWLDGINAGDGFIKQFVAMPLGMGYTVEGQVSGVEEHGGLQLAVFEPKRGRFPDSPPRPPAMRTRSAGFGAPNGLHAMAARAPTAYVESRPADAFAGQEMGLGAGGRMKQSIYPDKHGIDTWDQASHARVYVHLVNSQMWTEITGEPMPSSPVTARTYAQHGYPWFALYDEDRGDIGASSTLAGVKSVKEMDAEKGFAPQQDDSAVHIPGHLIKKAAPPTSDPADTTTVTDGAW